MSTKSDEDKLKELQITQGNIWYEISREEVTLKNMQFSRAPEEDKVAVRDRIAQLKRMDSYVKMEIKGIQNKEFIDFLTVKPKTD